MQEAEALSDAQATMSGLGTWGALGVLTGLSLWASSMLLGFVPVPWKRGGARRGRAQSKLREISGVQGSVWLIVAAMMFLAMSIGATLMVALVPGLMGSAEAGGSVQGSSPMRRMALLALGQFGLASLVGIVGVYVLLPRLSRGDWSGMRARWVDVPIGLLGLVLMVPSYVMVTMASAWVSANVFGVAVPKQAHVGLEAFVKQPGETWSIVFALTAVVVGPIAEELMYRGYLQSAMAALMVSGREYFGAAKASPTGARRDRWIAVGVTSGLFAAMHAAGGGPVPWAAVPGLFVLAMAMGAAFERTRSIGVPIVMHMGFNAANLLLAIAGAGGG